MVKNEKACSGKDTKKTKWEGVKHGSAISTEYRSYSPKQWKHDLKAIQRSSELTFPLQVQSTRPGDRAISKEEPLVPTGPCSLCPAPSHITGYTPCTVVMLLRIPRFSSGRAPCNTSHHVHISGEHRQQTLVNSMQCWLHRMAMPWGLDYLCLDFKGQDQMSHGTGPRHRTPTRTGHPKLWR